MIVWMISVVQSFNIIVWPKPFLKLPNLKCHVGHMTHFDTTGRKSQPAGTISRAYMRIHLWCNLEYSMVQDQKHLILLLTGDNWNFVLRGHIHVSWRAHVIIINWRSLECQICNSRYYFTILALWEMDSIVDFKRLMYETVLYSNEFALFRRQAWSNTQLYPWYGGALAFP